jgi:hypothetical protein
LLPSAAVTSFASQVLVTEGQYGGAEDRTKVREAAKVEIEADVPVVITKDDHPTVEKIGEETILKPQGRGDLTLSFYGNDLKRWIRELRDQ